MDILITIFTFAVILFILVVIHEWGHYIAAKKSGVIVEEFGFGLPPRVWGRKFGPPPKKGEEDTRTLWSLNLLPLGGFVRPRGEDSSIYDPTDKRNMQNAPLLNRMAIVLAGPFMNFVLGIVLFAVVYSLIGIPKSDGVFVGALGVQDVETGLDLQVGDRISEVNGIEVESIQQLEMLMRSNMEKSVEVSVLRSDGKEVKYQVLLEEKGFAGVYVDKVSEYSPAMEAGISRGDLILEADGVLVSSIDDLKSIVSEKIGSDVNLKVLMRDGRQVMLPVFARANPPEGQGAFGVVLYEPLPGLGILPTQDVEFVRYDWYVMPFVGIKQGFIDTYDLSRKIVPALGDVLKGLFVERDIPEGVGGPVQIAGVVSQICVVRDTSTNRIMGIDPISCMQIAALLSINLAVFNLLPIPALDGGRFAFYLVEGITRRRVSPRFEQLAHTIGLALLLLLMVIVTYNDIFNPVDLFK